MPRTVKWVLAASTVILVAVLALNWMRGRHVDVAEHSDAASVESKSALSALASDAGEATHDESPNGSGGTGADPIPKFDISPRMQEIYDRQKRLMPVLLDLARSFDWNHSREYVESVFHEDDIEAVMQLLEDESMRGLWPTVVNVSEFLRPSDAVAPALLRFVSMRDTYKPDEYEQLYAKVRAVTVLAVRGTPEGMEFAANVLSREQARDIVSGWSVQDINELYGLSSMSIEAILMSDVAWAIAGSGNPDYAYRIDSLYEEIKPLVRSYVDDGEWSQEGSSVTELFGELVRALVRRDEVIRLKRGETPTDISEQWLREREKYYNDVILELYN